MTSPNRVDTPLTPAEPATSLAWTTAGVPWGDLSVDQPDGFGSAAEPELPSPDLDDDRGYGFGV
jgi:hypothetical protein